jgi:hypothetical protein
MPPFRLSKSIEPDAASIPDRGSGLNKRHRSYRQLCLLQAEKALAEAMRTLSVVQFLTVNTGHTARHTTSYAVDQGICEIMST